LREIFKVLVN